MAAQFNAKVELDIRDSTPDWELYVQPQAPRGRPTCS